MSDTPPPEGEPTPPVKPPVIPPTKPDAGFSLKIIDNIEDADLKQSIQLLLAQNADFAKDNKEMKEIIVKQHTAREVEKYEKQRVEKLAKLGALHKQLAIKHKDTKDLGTLQTAIETAIDIKGKFAELKTDEDKDGKDKPKTHIKPTNYRK